MDPLRIIFIWLLAVVGVVAQGVNIPSLPTKSTNLATNDFFLVRETASGIDKKISVALMQTSGFGNTNVSGGSGVTNATFVTVNGTETDPLNFLNSSNVVWVVSGSNVTAVLTNVAASGNYVLSAAGYATNLTLVTPANSEWTNLYSQRLIGDSLTVGNSVIDGGTPFRREGIVMPNNGASDEYAVWEVSILKDESNPKILTNASTVWKMWHTIGWTGGGTTIGYAESTNNGTSWSRLSGAVNTNYMRSCVINDGGTYVMYATGLTETNITRFTSASGTNWVVSHANVLGIGAPGAWDDAYIGNSFVWKRGAGNYVMFYDARRSSTSWGEGYATSADGITWTKQTSYAVLGDGQGGGWFTNTTVNGVATWLAVVHGPPNSTALTPSDIYLYATTNTVPTNFVRVGTYPILARHNYDSGAFTANGQVADSWVIEHDGRIQVYYEGGYDGATANSPFDIYRAYTTLTWDDLYDVAGEPDRFKFQGYGNLTQLELDGLYPLKTYPSTYSGTNKFYGGIQNNDAGVFRIGYNTPGALDQYNTTNQGGFISFDARPGYDPVQFFSRAAGNANEGYATASLDTNGWFKARALYSSNWVGVLEVSGGDFASYVTNVGLFKVWTNNMPYFIDETGITNSVVVVTNGSISAGQVPKWDGSRWYAANDTAGTNSSEVYINAASVAAPNFQDSSTALIRVASAVTNISVYPTNLANAQIASGAAIAVSKLEQIDLGTDTAGNYAAGDAEGGAALTGDSATAFFSAGQIERARGGTGADTSAYGAGLLGSDGSNNTIDVDTAAELETALGGINVILSTEIDTSSEVAGIVGDETGTGAMVFSSAPNLTNSVAYTLLNVTNGVLAMSGPLQYTSETISASDIDWSTGNSFYKQLTGNTTFTFSGQQNDYHIRAFLEQDGTGGRTVTWPAGVVWLSTTNQSTTAPNVDTNASRVTIVDLFRRNGTNYGTMFGANARPLEDIAGVVSAAAGDILYYTGTVWTNLARGSTGQVLTTTNSTIQWLNAAAGTGSGDVLYTAFATSQFGTNGGVVYIKDGAVVTNLNVRNNLTVTNSATIYDLTVSNAFSVLNTLSANSLVVSNSITASNLAVTNLFTAYKGLFTNELAIPYDPAPTTDANGELAIDSTITDHRPLAQFRANSTNYYLVSIPTADLVATDGYVIKYDAANDKFTMAADATGAGGGDPVLVNGTAVGDGSGVAFTNTSTAVWEIDETTTPDLAKVYPTNIANAQIASGAAIAVSKLEAIDLGTDTVGNYVIDVAGTAPDITSTHTPAEGSTATLSFTRPSTADVALSASHATLSSTGIVFEGATADTLEGRLVSADITGADVTWTLPNSTGTIALLGGITLGTDTAGNYAAGDAEGGAALTGDSATAFFSAGQIERARGGTGADTSAYGNGLIGSDGSNNTLDVDTISEFSTALGITGTPSGSTFLRGDGVWGTPAGSGDVSRTDFNTNQFVTNATTWAIAIKDGAITTNLAVSSGTLTANAATVTNALRLSARSASTILATDSNKDVSDVAVSAPITFSGGTLDLDETAAIGNNARVAVNKNSGATVGTRRRINFIEGSNVTLTVADDSGNEEVDVTIAASGTGSGDNAYVNGTDVTGAFSLTNTVASSTVASTTWSVTGNTDPVQDLVTVAIGAASQTDAGIVTAGTQTIGGAKTFAGDVTITNLTVASTFSVTGDLSVGSLVVTNPVNNLYVTNLYLTNATASRAVFADSNRKLVTTGASADLSGALSDETGTGVSVFNTDPSILGLRLWGDSNQTNLFRFNANGSIHSNAVGTIQFKSGGGQFGGGTTDLAPGSGGVIATNFVRSNTGTFTNSLTLNGAAVMTNRVGVYRTFFVPAAAMEITTTNGATPSTFTPTGADNYTVDTYQFLNSVTNRVNFITTMPDEWDTTTTIKVKFHYVTKTATAANPVVWQVAAGAIADAGTPGATLGSFATSTDTTQSQNVLAISPASGALTIGNTPALGKQVLFQVLRDANNAGDTYADTVELLGIQIQYKELSTEPTVW